MARWPRPGFVLGLGVGMVCMGALRPIVIGCFWVADQLQDLRGRQGLF